MEDTGAIRFKSRREVDCQVPTSIVVPTAKRIKLLKTFLDPKLEDKLGLMSGDMSVLIAQKPLKLKVSKRRDDTTVPIEL